MSTNSNNICKPEEDNRFFQELERAESFIYSGNFSDAWKKIENLRDSSAPNGELKIRFDNALALIQLLKSKDLSDAKGVIAQFCDKSFKNLNSDKIQDFKNRAREIEYFLDQVQTPHNATDSRFDEIRCSFKEYISSLPGFNSSECLSGQNWIDTKRILLTYLVLRKPENKIPQTEFLNLISDVYLNTRTNESKDESNTYSPEKHTKDSSELLVDSDKDQSSHETHRQPGKIQRQQSNSQLSTQELVTQELIDAEFRIYSGDFSNAYKKLHELKNSHDLDVMPRINNALALLTWWDSFRKFRVSNSPKCLSHARRYIAQFCDESFVELCQSREFKILAYRVNDSLSKLRDSHQNTHRWKEFEEICDYFRSCIFTIFVSSKRSLDIKWQDTKCQDTKKILLAYAVLLRQEENIPLFVDVLSEGFLDGLEKKSEKRNLKPSLLISSYLSYLAVFFLLIFIIWKLVSAPEESAPKEVSVTSTVMTIEKPVIDSLEASRWTLKHAGVRDFFTNALLSMTSAYSAKSIYASDFIPLVRVPDVRSVLAQSTFDHVDADERALWYVFDFSGGEEPCQVLETELPEGLFSPLVRNFVCIVPTRSDDVLKLKSYLKDFTSQDVLRVKIDINNICDDIKDGINESWCDYGPRNGVYHLCHSEICR